MIDLQSERIEIYPGKFGVDIINEYWIKPQLSESAMLENDVFKLSEYLDFMSKYSSDMEEDVSRMGEKIWTQLR